MQREKDGIDRQRGFQLTAEVRLDLFPGISINRAPRPTGESRQSCKFNRRVPLAACIEKPTQLARLSVLPNNVGTDGNPPVFKVIE